MKKEATYFGVKEIARRANVSIATVDRVLHNRSGVSEKTKKKINDIITELDYQPNILASRLASKKIISLAVLIPRVSEETDFWEAPLRGISRAEAEIRKYGIQVSEHFFDLNDKHSFETQAQLVLGSDVQGVLLSPTFLDESRDFLQKCHDRKIPFVLIDSDVPDLDRLCYIGPHLFQSGYVGAKLLTYRLKENHKVLVLNISQEADSYNFMQIEEGFRAYFSDHQQPCEIIRSDISHTDPLSITRDLTRILHEHSDLEAIFVTNSRVFAVAAFLKKAARTDISLIGYDFLKQNITYLKEGLIDFLICHKPEEQGYRGMMALYQKLVLGATIEKVHFMPIDIITKENQAFYQN
ncbi:LacI family DNA-binding transcriptional regulator [Dyadobacter sandarakinus]|uniref:Substrate-binding domain-containing protein n=1 Tax=Dyadobacter sandarakinus TaxID=2747268 RepID=A0ABX7IDL3_9BACT|nr:substrate-binding domain-containing protein [Dyadobacter sandarakinus]QRR04217.1 substrate-binding domain-containing protein [Dyadobacter sandarakinus]